MKLDTEFKSEIRKAAKNHDFKQKLRGVTKLLENRYKWDDAFKEFGRAIVAVSVSASILSRPSCEFDKLYKDWAKAVISVLDDNGRRYTPRGLFFLHPALIQDNIYSLIRLTDIDI